MDLLRHAGGRVSVPRRGAPRFGPLLVGAFFALVGLLLFSLPVDGSPREIVPAAPGHLPMPAATKSVSETTLLPVVWGAQPSPTPTPTPVCPRTSGNSYSAGMAYQYDQDNPVRPAHNHADKNLKLRGYAPYTDPGLSRSLVDYGSDDPTQPPQFATLFAAPRVPQLSGFYRVFNWLWAASPNPGTRGSPLIQYRITALGLQVTKGEALHVPASGYDIGEGMEVIVLFADDRTIALRYGRQDSSGAQGYTVHIDNICTDPNLLALYEALDAPAGPRYQYVGPGYAYGLTALPAGAPLGTARSAEVVVAIADTGTFLDPRSCNEWWQIRPGYAGGCPWHD